jgi:hypothetical protein
LCGNTQEHNPDEHTHRSNILALRVDHHALDGVEREQQRQTQLQRARDYRQLAEACLPLVEIRLHDAVVVANEVVHAHFRTVVNSAAHSRTTPCHETHTRQEPTQCRIATRYHAAQQ